MNNEHFASLCLTLLGIGIMLAVMAAGMSDRIRDTEHKIDSIPVVRTCVIPTEDSNVWQYCKFDHGQVVAR